LIHESDEKLHKITNLINNTKHKKRMTVMPSMMPDNLISSHEPEPSQHDCIFKHANNLDIQGSLIKDAI
jgi:hypothetical protein